MAKEKILIVEDEGIVSLHIKQSVESLGYSVAGVVHSGDDAIVKATELRPDLVLMDIVLKGAVDGIEAAEKIRSIINIPVVYLTAHVDEGTLQRAKVTTPSGYVVKPFKERDLYIAIEFALYKSKMEAEKNHLVIRLQDALSQIKTLSGLLPICSSCKKIRDDGGYWKKIELYLKQHSDLELTHSLCPQCSAKYLPSSEKE